MLRVDVFHIFDKIFNDLNVRRLCYLISDNSYIYRFFSNIIYHYV